MQDLMHTARWRWSAAGAVAGYCPSSRTCLLRVALWAAVNLGTIAPVMT